MGLVEKDSEGIRLRPDGKPIKLAVETTTTNNRVLELVASHWTAVGVKHDTFRNVPEVAMASWAVSTPANTAVECYAIEP